MLKPRIHVSVVLWIIFHCYFFGVNAKLYNNGIEFGSGSNTVDPMEPENKLIFAHVLYRHGDRNILFPYKNDPWKSVKHWPGGFAQLTNLGKQQQYQLGKWLKKRYSSLLGKDYDRKQIYVQSTDVDRTLMSALANLAGLYKPNSEENWSHSIQWQPIPVHTSPPSDDVLSGRRNCPAYSKLYYEFQESQEFQNIQNRYVSFYEYLAEKTGEVIRYPSDVQDINSILFIETLYNKTLPEWTKKVYGSPEMTYLSNFAFSMRTYTRQLARLKVGPLISEMLQRFKDKLKDDLVPDRSVWIYSAHDTTVANVLNTLKLFDPPHTPPYAACIMLELRLDIHNNPYVSIFYKNTTDEPKAMEIPSCGAVCPLEQMFNLYKDILPINWEAECNLQENRETTTTTKSPWNRHTLFNEENHHLESDEVVMAKPFRAGQVSKGERSHAPELKFIFLMAVIGLFVYGVVTYYRRRNIREYFRFL